VVDGEGGESSRGAEQSTAETNFPDVIEIFAQGDKGFRLKETIKNVP